MTIETNSPLVPPEQSMGKLLFDLEIVPVYGNVDGIFCLDWGYIAHTEIDQLIMNRAIRSEATDDLALYTRTKDGGHSHPLVSADSEIEYCFLSARFSRVEEQFFIFVEVEKAGECLYKFEQTVPYFRHLFRLDKTDADEQEPSRASRSSLDKAKILSGP